jgi:small conductance mechanosensitive channel
MTFEPPMLAAPLTANLITEALSPDALRAIGRQARDLGINLALAIGLAILGVWLAGRAAAFVRQALSRSGRIDGTLVSFLSSMVRWAIIVFIGLAILSNFGVQTTSIVAVLGAATLAVGLSLQGTLSHLAAGVMLVLFRPYRIGDAVEIAGRQGVVREITIFTTEIVAADNTKVVIPNGQAWGQTIVNFTAFETRRVDFALKIGLDDDFDRASAVVAASFEKEARALREPEVPAAMVTDFTDSQAILSVKVWVRTDDLISAKADFPRMARLALKAAGFAPAFPTTRQV